MLWVAYTRYTPNFASCFHVGVFSHILATYSMFYYPQKMKTEKGSYECMIQENLYIFWLFSMLTLCAAFGIKTYHRIHDGRHIWKSRDEKLKDLKIGTIGFLACSIVQLVPGYMENGSCAGYIVLALAHLASSVFLGFFIMQQSYLCKFPEGSRITLQLKTFSLMILTEAILQIFHQISTSQFLYLNVVACFLIDARFLFAHSSNVYFLEEFLGERVVCKDALNGNEYRGHFVSLDGDNYSHMHLKLKHVEKIIEGKFVEQSEDVTVQELSSLVLVKDQPSTLTSYVEKKCDGEFVKHTEDALLA
ncbi:hypothetical protein CAEBREN_09513 [Caenorhabditis brenneri]|uniref:Uncharacterized protein n=1 Tax=Caenorhabditis brenneri TaxID=135651 RepID=G0MGG7_CAEBE|nr:hypothetical protein CAEBREN_09513 [Caenorhabditis brenneri]